MTWHFKVKLTRRPATEADIPFLLGLRRETMDDHLLASGADTSEASHRERLLYRFDCAEVLLMKDEPVGLLKVDHGDSEWKVIQIQLSPAVQGQGVGRQVLEGVIADARKAGVDVVLSVLKANPARSLYERLGFLVEGEDSHEYFMRLATGAPAG